MQKNEGFFKTWKLSRELCTTISISREILLFQVLSNREHWNDNRSQHLLSTHYVLGPVPCGFLKSPHFSPPSTLGSRCHYYPHFHREKFWRKEVQPLTLGHAANKRKSLPSNPDWPESKSCESTTHQETGTHGTPYKQHCTPASTVYCNNSETWLIIGE